MMIPPTSEEKTGWFGLTFDVRIRAGHITKAFFLPSSCFGGIGAMMMDGEALITSVSKWMICMMGRG